MFYSAAAKLNPAERRILKKEKENIYKLWASLCVIYLSLSTAAATAPTASLVSVDGSSHFTRCRRPCRCCLVLAIRFTIRPGNRCAADGLKETYSVTLFIFGSPYFSGHLHCSPTYSLSYLYRIYTIFRLFFLSFSWLFWLVSRSRNCSTLDGSRRRDWKSNPTISLGKRPPRQARQTSSLMVSLHMQSCSCPANNPENSMSLYFFSGLKLLWGSRVSGHCAPPTL